MNGALGVADASSEALPENRSSKAVSGQEMILLRAQNQELIMLH